MNCSHPTFLFDIGNVIIKFDFEIAVRKVAPACSTPALEILPTLQPLTDRFERGEFPVAEFVAIASDTIGFSGTEAEFISAFEDIFELNHPVADLIHSLASHGQRLCLLSNTNAIHVPFFTEKWPDVFSRFENGIFSHEAGVMKPNPKIFEITIDQLDLTPENTIYIDDRADNCESGSAAGLQAFRYNHQKHDDLTDFLSQKFPVLSPMIPTS